MQIKLPPPQQQHVAAQADGGTHQPPKPPRQVLEPLWLFAPNRDHTMTRTVHVPRVVKQYPEALLEVHPDDAQGHGLEDGALAAVQSRRGRLTVRVQVSPRIRPGTVFLPMHWGASQPQPCEANRLMHEQADALSKQPELKAAAVRLEPAGP